MGRSIYIIEWGEPVVEKPEFLLESTSGPIGLPERFREIILEIPINEVAPALPSSEAFFNMNPLPKPVQNAVLGYMLLHKSLSAAGIPRTQSAQTPKEDALGLLSLAAEVEHALMVQYLYAWQSLKVENATDSQLKAASVILNIAIQEMFHLLSVQNLLIALGGPEAAWMARDSIRTNSQHNPIPFDLSRVTVMTLAKLIVAEMPAFIPDEDLRHRVAELERRVEMSTGMQANRVGSIYSALSWLFQADDSRTSPTFLSTEMGYRPGWHVKPEDFADRALIETHAGTREEWQALREEYILQTVFSPDDALDLLHQISEQGEGLETKEDSHFEALISLLDKVESAELSVNLLPSTPYGVTPPPRDSQQITPIENDYTLLLSELFDLRYLLVILDISHALASSAHTTERRVSAGLAFAQMKTAITKLGELLSTHRLGVDGSGIAGPSYGLPDQPIPSKLAEIRERTARALARQAEVIRAIRSHPDFTGHIEGFLIEDLEFLDSQRDGI